MKINFYRRVANWTTRGKKSSSPDKKLIAQLFIKKKSHSSVEDARGLWGQYNFEKLNPKSCNLSERKVILLNWKTTNFGGGFCVFLHLTCPLAVQFLKFGFDFIEYMYVM